MKKIFNILIYISFIFLIIYLYKFDYIKLKSLDFNWLFIIISVILFWIGILLSSVSWWISLKKHHVIVKIREAIISHGLAIFSKYIPGKIWVILGRASHISISGYPIKITSMASLKEQLIYVWVGLMISVIPMLLLYSFSKFTIIVLGILVLLTFFNFSVWFHKLVMRMIKYFIKKPLDLPLLNFNESKLIILYCMYYWVIWMAGFYFLVRSIYTDAGLSVVFAFPLGVTLGLLALIIPSGLGVREGIITGYLHLSGVPLEYATTISIIARL